jgi:hypothetical protein
MFDDIPNDQVQAHTSLAATARRPTVASDTAVTA